MRELFEKYVTLAHVCPPLYLSVASCISRFVCRSLCLHVLPYLYSTVCMTVLYVCPLHVYVPSMCILSLCTFRAHLLSCVCPSMCMFLYVYVPSMCMFSLCVFRDVPSMCECPLISMSLRVYIHPLHIYDLSVRISLCIYVASYVGCFVSSSLLALGVLIFASFIDSFVCMSLRTF